MKLSLIAPCYNEAENVAAFQEAVIGAFANCGYDYEIVFVDDGSKDATLHNLKKIFAQQKCPIKIVSFSRNFGKEAAMYAGFCNAHGDYVAVMDADMQDPPELLPQMLSILEEGEYDSVATRRVTRDGEPPIRSFFARMFYRIINRISEADIVDGARDFRLMRREMVDAIVSMCEYNRFSKGIFGWIGFRTKWLPYKNIERVAGETKWSFFKLFKYSIDGIAAVESMLDPEFDVVTYDLIKDYLKDEVDDLNWTDQQIDLIGYDKRCLIKPAPGDKVRKPEPKKPAPGRNKAPAGRKPAPGGKKRR